MHNENAVIYRKELQWLTLAESFLSKNDVAGFMGRLRDSEQDLFYEGGNLRFSFLVAIPVESLGMVRRTLDVLKYVSGYNNEIVDGEAGKMAISTISQKIAEIKEYLQAYLNVHSSFTVFYSWQSDIDSKFNRNFIENILDKSISEITKNVSIQLFLDKNALGETGSPDIFNTILSKIDSAMAFVADITSITKCKSKEISNPNVMCELGYAFSALGNERVILLCNTAFTDIKNLPFDLGFKRMVTYRLNSQSTPEEKEKQRLCETLTEALQSIANI
jgi:hypothetical protein